MDYIAGIVYFFSNFFLINTGFIFILPLFFKTKEEYDRIKSYIFGNSLPIIFGITGLGLSVLLLFFPLSLAKNPIIILDDLIPSAAIILMSVIYLFGYIRITKYIDKKMIKKGDVILTSIQVPVGFLGILVGLVHVFLGRIIFL